MKRRLAIAFVLSMLLTGCSLFSRSKSQFYSLEQIAPSAAVSNLSGLPVAIDALELPPGFDRREIVVRQSDRRLEVRSSQQWSASLEKMALHTLAFDLASRLRPGTVILPGQAKPSGPIRSIDVLVAELAPGPERVLVLDARWTLRQPGQPDSSRHERIAIDVPSLDSAQIAMGISRALAELADRIVAQLK